MKDLNNIDDLYKSAFEGYQESPPDFIWGNISNHLNNNIDINNDVDDNTDNLSDNVSDSVSNTNVNVDNLSDCVNNTLNNANNIINTASQTVETLSAKSNIITTVINSIQAIAVNSNAISSIVTNIQANIVTIAIGGSLLVGGGATYTVYEVINSNDKANNIELSDNYAKTVNASKENINAIVLDSLTNEEQVNVSIDAEDFVDENYAMGAKEEEQKNKTSFKDLIASKFSIFKNKEKVAKTKELSGNDTQKSFKEKEERSRTSKTKELSGKDKQKSFREKESIVKSKEQIDNKKLKEESNKSLMASNIVIEDVLIDKKAESLVNNTGEKTINLLNNKDEESKPNMQNIINKQTTEKANKINVVSQAKNKYRKQSLLSNDLVVNYTGTRYFKNTCIFDNTSLMLVGNIGNISNKGNKYKPNSTYYSRGAGIAYNSKKWEYSLAFKLMYFKNSQSISKTLDDISQSNNTEVNYKLRYAQLPLTATYKIYLNRFTLGVATGVELSYLYNQKHHSKHLEAIYSESNLKPYTNKYALSNDYHIGLDYNVFRNVSLSASGYYKLYLKTFWRDTKQAESFGTQMAIKLKL